MINMLLFGLNIPDILIILIIELIGAVVFIVSFLIYNKNRFTAYICERYLNTLKIKKKVRPSLTQTNFNWGKFAYAIDFSYAIVDNKGKPVLYYVYQLAKPIIPLNEIKNKEDSQVFKVVNDGKIMTHLGDRKMTKTYMYLIMGLIIIIGIVAVVSIYFQQENGKEMARLVREMMNVTKALINNDGGSVVIP